MIAYGIAIALVAAAAYAGAQPWLTHGGRFVTEYMLLAAALIVVAAIVAWITWALT